MRDLAVDQDTAASSSGVDSSQSIAKVRASGKWGAVRPGARFTKYLTTILRLSYDNAKVTTNLRQTSNLQNILQ